MALTETDIEEFIALVQQNAGLRERVRRALIDGDFERISESLAQIAAVQAESKTFEGEMRSFQADAEKRFDTVDKRFDAVDRRFDAIDKRFDGVDQRMDGMDQRFNRIEGELGNIRGELFESRFSRNYGQMLGRRFRHIRPLVLSDYQPVHDLMDQGKISGDDWDELSRSDALMLVRDRGASAEDDLVAVFEISRVVDRDDVERARRRAHILSAAGLSSVACAVGEGVTEGALAAAADDVALFAYRRDPVGPPAL